MSESALRGNEVSLSTGSIPRKAARDHEKGLNVLLNWHSYKDVLMNHRTRGTTHSKPLGNITYPKAQVCAISIIIPILAIMLAIIVSKTTFPKSNNVNNSLR